MSLGTIITNLRKNHNITQDALAQQLGVTNQAVSKWESDQCCPDVMLLPKIADIFAVSVDTLFGRTSAEPAKVHGLPWQDDATLRVVVYTGHTLIGNSQGEKEFVFTYEGPALNVESRISVNCGTVDGNVTAGTCVSCGNVSGNIDAGSHVSCGNVEGNIDAGSNVHCGNVIGDIEAGANIKCGNVSGNASAGMLLDFKK